MPYNSRVIDHLRIFKHDTLESKDKHKIVFPNLVLIEKLIFYQSSSF